MISGEKKLYIWVYNGNEPATDLVTEECYEWALFTGDWTLPTSSTQTTLPLEFRTSTADAGAPIYGGLNNVQAIDGGSFIDPITYELQTHEICLDAIPEPSGSLLLVLGAGSLLTRRFRK